MVKNKFKVVGKDVIIYINHKGSVMEAITDYITFWRLHKSDIQYRFCVLRDTSIKSREKYYVAWMERVGDKGKRKTKTHLLHRIIMKYPEGMVVDHKDGNPLNNRRNNLRVVTVAQNSQNRYGAEIRSTTGIRGVYYDKRKKYHLRPWRARAKANGKVVFDKNFRTQKEAEEAVIEARKQYHK